MGYVHIWRSIYLSVKKNGIYDNRKINKYSNQVYYMQKYKRPYIGEQNV